MSPTSLPRRLRVAVTVGALAATATTGGVAYAATSSPAPSATSPSSSPSSGSTAAPSESASTTAPRPGPRAGDGVVTSVDSDSLTVRDATGTSRTYQVTSSTKIHRGPGETLTLADLSAGDRVKVRTSSDSSDDSTAVDIDQHLAHLDGIVSAVSGSTVTITDRDGFRRVIELQDSTTYRSSGEASSRSAVVTGEQVRAQGRVASDGTSLDASSVDVSTPGEEPAPPAGGPGAGGPGGNGPRDGGPGEGGPGEGGPGRVDGQATPAAPEASPAATSSGS